MTGFVINRVETAGSATRELDSGADLHAINQGKETLLELAQDRV